MEIGAKQIIGKVGLLGPMGLGSFNKVGPGINWRTGGRKSKAGGDFISILNPGPGVGTGS